MDDKPVMLIVDDVEIDVEIKMKKKTAEKDDIVQALMKEIQQLKKTVVQNKGYQNLPSTSPGFEEL